MTSDLATETVAAEAAGGARYRLTVEQFEQMVRAGILHEHARIELLEGELYQMSGIGDWHNAGTDSLNWFLSGPLRERAIVRVQGSFRLSAHSEPQPDAIVLRFRPDFYRSAPAGPEDVLLIVEVADTSLSYDRNVKLPLYARAGIPEVWIVCHQPAQIEVHRDPHNDHYRSRTLFERDETVSPEAFPDIVIPVREILG